MKTGLIIIILIVVILLFMAAGWYVMNKIDGFMNRTRRTNDKDTMNAVLNESDIERKIKENDPYFNVQELVDWVEDIFKEIYYQIDNGNIEKLSAIFEDDYYNRIKEFFQPHGMFANTKKADHYSINNDEVMIGFFLSTIILSEYHQLLKILL